MADDLATLEARYDALTDKRGKDAHALREEIRAAKNRRVAQVAAGQASGDDYGAFADKVITGLVTAHGISELGKSSLEDTLVNIGVAHMAVRVARGEPIDEARESERRGAAQGRAWGEWLRMNRPKAGGYGDAVPPTPEAPKAAPEITHAPSDEAVEALRERAMRAATRDAVAAVAGEIPDFTPAK
jgi:hypothetical protein